MIKLMCRLCEQWIPLSAVEQHSESCQLAYEACYRMKDLDRKLQKLEDIIVKQFLCGPWPGDEVEAITQNLPLLHLRQILCQMISLDIDCDCAKRDLYFLVHAIDEVSLVAADPSVMNIVAKAKVGAQQKLEQLSAYSEASAVQKKTRIGGSGGSGSRIAVSLSDFVFIKPISSGAFARVFLARKAQTGDIFAIKVTPTSRLRQKGDVKRVLVEKDILIQFNNPFIVNFCMDLSAFTILNVPF
jgi:hypothetical protein